MAPTTFIVLLALVPLMTLTIRLLSRSDQNDRLAAVRARHDDHEN